MQGTFHRIISAQPETWTLFEHGPRLSSWGFLEWAGEGWYYRNYQAHIGEGGDAGAMQGSERNGMDKGSKQRWFESAPMGEDVGREPFITGL